VKGTKIILYDTGLGAFAASELDKVFSNNTCTRPAAINNGNNSDGQSITLLY